MKVFFFSKFEQIGQFFSFCFDIIFPPRGPAAVTSFKVETEKKENIIRKKTKRRRKGNREKLKQKLKQKEKKKIKEKKNKKRKKQKKRAFKLLP